MPRTADAAAVLVIGALLWGVPARLAEAGSPVEVAVFSAEEQAIIEQATALRRASDPKSLRRAIQLLESLAEGKLTSDRARTNVFERLTEHYHALSYTDRSKLDQAIASATNVLLDDPLNPWALMVRCDSFRRYGQLVQARNDCDLARRYFEKRRKEGTAPGAYFERNLRQVEASLLRLTGHYDQGRSLLTGGSFSAEAEREWTVRQDLARIERDRGNYEGARAEYAAALSKAERTSAPDVYLAELLGELAEIDALLGRLDQAIVNYGRAYEGSGEPEYLYLKCVAEIRAKRLPSAAESCALAAERSDNPAYSDAYVYVLQLMGRDAVARRTLATALERFPKNTMLRNRALRLASPRTVGSTVPATTATIDASD